MPQFRIAATVNPEQLATLLLAAKAADVKLELGVAADDEPLRPRKSTPRKRSTKKNKPKRHGRHIVVRVGPEPEGPPKLVQLHRALKKKFGNEPFVKGEAKGALVKIAPSPSSYITKLMDGGNLIAAQ